MKHTVWERTARVYRQSASTKAGPGTAKPTGKGDNIYIYISYTFIHKCLLNLLAKLEKLETWRHQYMFDSCMLVRDSASVFQRDIHKNKKQKFSQPRQSGYSLKPVVNQIISAVTIHIQPSTRLKLSCGFELFPLLQVNPILVLL